MPIVNDLPEVLETTEPVGGTATGMEAGTSQSQYSRLTMTARATQASSGQERDE